MLDLAEGTDILVTNCEGYEALWRDLTTEQRQQLLDQDPEATLEPAVRNLLEGVPGTWVNTAGEFAARPGVHMSPPFREFLDEKRKEAAVQNHIPRHRKP